MHIIKRIHGDIYRLFFPQACGVCGRELPYPEQLVCTYCRWELPLAGFSHRHNNPVFDKLSEFLPLQQACSYFYYIHDSPFRALVHGFKYSGQWKNAETMGRWFAQELRDSGLYDDVDLIVPVPLHLRKRLVRGYNQSEYIARGIGRSLGVPVDVHSLKRTVHNPSQTKRNKEERWDNVEGIFIVNRPQALAGRHILLVDDVLTTGATVLSCAEALLRSAEGTRVSIVTLAVSRTELEKQSQVPFHLWRSCGYCRIRSRNGL